MKQYSQIELIKGKGSRKKLNKGDIFTLQISGDSYLIGHITHVNIVSYDSSIDTCVLIYNKIFSQIELEKHILFDNYKVLYNKPILLNSTFWRRGILNVIGNTPLTTKEENTDFTFYSMLKQCMVDVNGNKIEGLNVSKESHFGLYNPYGIVADIKNKMSCLDDQINL